MQMPSWMPEPGSPVDRIATFLMANLLWLALAMPIITLPAATAGLFATLGPWVRGRDTELFATFFGAMRRHWLKGTLVAVIDAIIGFVIYVNIRALGFMEMDSLLLWLMRSINLFIAITLLMINLYVWPLLVLFDLSFRRLIVVSVRMALGHSFWSLLVLSLAVAPAIVALFIPPFVSVLLLFSLIALIVNWGAWRIIRKYATPEELAELNQH
ncbi:MAG: DUF624 domain-containing protein [Anaerolineae bacterium]|nr:DUF624 domain-containing protein [Anaerolineae bacterium]